MYTTGHVLLEPVRDQLRYDPKSPVLKARYSCATLFPRSGIPLEKQKLYIVPEETAAAAAAAHPDAFFVTLAHGLESTNNLLILQGEMDPDRLLNIMQNRMEQVQDWYEKLQKAVIYGSGLQQILDMSEEIIGQYIAITDYTLRLLANTKKIHTDCEVCQDLLKNGVHTGRTLERFQKNNRFQYWAAHEFYVDETHSISKYALCGAVFRFGSTYYNHAVMTMKEPEADPSSVELFRLFSETIRPLVAKDWEKAETFAHLYDGLILDLVRGKMESRETIEIRARYAKLPASGRFLLFICPFSRRKEYPVGRLGNEMNNLSDQSWVVYADRELICLQYFDEGSFEDQVKDLCGRMSKILKKHSLTCGGSSLFEHLEQLRIAYLQAKYAHSVIEERWTGKCSLKEQCLKEQCFRLNPDRIVMFNEVFEFCFMDCSAEKLEMLGTSRFYRSLKALRDYDIEHHTNNLQLLRVYLESERRVLETAELMHMHRNNVTYRIQKIQEITGFDLGDSKERFRILETYLILNKAADSSVSLFTD